MLTGNRTNGDWGALVSRELNGGELFGTTNRLIAQVLNRPLADTPAAHQEAAEQARAEHVKLVAAREAFAAAEKTHKEAVAKVDADKAKAWAQREAAVVATEKRAQDREAAVAERERAVKAKEALHARKIAAFEKCYMTRTGTVKWFDPDRGFGFIAPLDADSGDVFLHIHGLAPGCPVPAVGDRVQYVIGSGKDGRPRAQNVRVLEAVK